MAREVAAILGSKLKDPVRLDLLPAGGPAIEVRIEDLDLCPRYSALVFENVTIRPSPLWLQYRLTAIGLNPISNIVDMTNFVMAELAQPMHAFDADSCAATPSSSGPRAAGERFRALNGRMVHARSRQPGDRRCRRRHRPGRRDRRRGQRHRRQHHARGAGERQLPGVLHPQDLVRHQAAHRRFHALRKGAGPGQHRARHRPRHRAAARNLARHPHGGRRGRSRSATCRRPRPSACRSTGWSANWAAPSRPPKCAAFWRAWNSAWPNRSPASSR